MVFHLASKRGFIALAMMFFGLVATPQTRADVELRDGRLQYKLDARGNRLPDFSYAGFRAGEGLIPFVPAQIALEPIADDDTALIQAAIDAISKLAPSDTGFRGAVLLKPGTYRISQPLRLGANGVVLRGSGAGEGGTTLLATGTGRHTVIEVSGTRPATLGQSIEVADDYVPVNAMQLNVASAQGLAVGELVEIRHPCTKAWIAALGMNDFGGDRHGPAWRPGSRDIRWLRRVLAMKGNTVQFDAPLTLAMDASYGRCELNRLDTSGLVANVGIENLRIVSEFDANQPKDEEHAWFGISINHARDIWVRRVTCQHLAGSAIAAWEGSSRVTVQDCKSLQPVSETGGWRRNAFFTNGQQILMQRLFSEHGVHDFCVGLAAAGPNAFVQCESVGSLGESGTIDSGACGSLFDRVRIDGQPMALRNRMYQGQGVGWASFNGVLWNCSASVIINEMPPGASNWAYGAHGEYSGNGIWVNSDDDVRPHSLYTQQLTERIGKEAADEMGQHLLPPVQGSRAPTLEQAAQAIEVSMQPRIDMSHWIDQLAARGPIDIEVARIKNTLRAAPAMRKVETPLHSMQIQNGWITIDDRLVIGKEIAGPWWNGGVRPDDLLQAKPALTRYVPGRIGAGLTDDLASVVRSMRDQGQVLFWQHPPLWYERRRDDHSRVQRMDGDVVAPFYETPWARSGSGTASDGLSRWDLTRLNSWYFARLEQFARLAAADGKLLFNGLYMQHNVLEAGAHYVDAPWRTANNINQPGFPEPVFFAGDKLIYIARQFYDIKEPRRAELHQIYMRQVLDRLADQPNVVFFLSEEFTGPAEFVEFWLDVVARWQSDTGRRACIALYATKDVTDQVMADPQRAKTVSLIYNRSYGDGWWYQPDGTLYAPQGGKDLAPRQWSRLLKPKAAGFSEVLRAVHETRQAYPDKPFVYQGDDKLAWAVLLGGGSIPPLPATTDQELLRAVVKMRPLIDRTGLADDLGNRLIISETRPKATSVRAIDMRTGQVTTDSSKLYWIQP